MSLIFLATISNIEKSQNLAWLVGVATIFFILIIFFAPRGGNDGDY